jgi:hypothetical protein
MNAAKKRKKIFRDAIFQNFTLNCILFLIFVKLLHRVCEKFIFLNKTFNLISILQKKNPLKRVKYSNYRKECFKSAAENLRKISDFDE